MTADLSWRVPVVVADLPLEGEEFNLVPDAATRAELARLAGVLAVPSLEANLHVAPDGGGGAIVRGPLRGVVTQECVVTLEPFDNPISEEIFVRFAPPDSIAEESDRSIDFGSEDPPDPLVGGAFDLADVVAEFLSLAVDPYPRKPGAVFAAPEGIKAGKESSPFAALEKLKDRGRKKG
jgi:uncharacterized metal-binding protein YceD (DUF177 family)